MTKALPANITDKRGKIQVLKSYVYPLHCIYEADDVNLLVIVTSRSNLIFVTAFTFALTTNYSKRNVILVVKLNNSVFMDWTMLNRQLSTLQACPPANILSVTDNYSSKPWPIYISLKHCYLYRNTQR